MQLSLDHIQLIIFDLDGTLYDLKKIRAFLSKRFFLNLLTCRMHKTDLKIISTFRKEREKHKGYHSANLETEQYQWCAGTLHLPEEQIRNTIEKYMHKLPLRFLKKTRYRHVEKYFSLLKQYGIKTAVYSDYPVAEKLNALELSTDMIICSTDAEIGEMKPSAKALKMICGHFACQPGKALFIGDRDDTDGVSASLAGIAFLKVDTRKARRGTFYKDLCDILNTSRYEK